MKKEKGRNNVKYSKLLIIASLFLFVIMILRLLQLSLSKTIDDTNLQELASKLLGPQPLAPKGEQYIVPIMMF